MAQVIKFSFNALASDTVLYPEWNNTNQTGGMLLADTEIIADLHDVTLASTGYTLRTVLAWDGVIQRLGTATGEQWGVPEEVWDRMGNASVTGDYLRFTGLPAGETFSLQCAAEGFGATRDTTFDTDALDTDGPILYDNTGDEDGTPTQPITLTGTIPAGGVLNLNMAMSDTQMHLNFVILTIAVATDKTQVGALDVEFTVNGTQGLVSAPLVDKSVTVTGIVGGANLTGLKYTVWSGQNLSETLTFIANGTGGATDANGDITLDISSSNAVDGEALLIVFGGWNLVPTATDRGIITYGNAVVA